MQILIPGSVHLKATPWYPRGFSLENSSMPHYQGHSHPMKRLLFFLIAILPLVPPMAKAEDKPNFIFILSDDLAQGDVGCYGQKLIKTPRLDQMAAEGTRYTQAYSGTSVCAPSRASLMTGLHMGHCPIRANREIQPEGQLPLPEETYTVAQLLQDNGYATACTGKWGMGMFDTTGSPLKKGFDFFYGYNCQRHAHTYFPSYLYRNDERIPLDGKTYAQELITQETVKWITQQKDKPFFLFFAITLPHGKYEIDDQGVYRDKPWTTLQKNYAAMVTRLDSDVGRVLDAVKEIGADDNTLVILCGDNGSSFAPDSEIGRLFEQAQGLRGFKRGMYEGALRQAAIARWPGTVPAGVVRDEPWAFWDYLPTVAALAEIPLPQKAETDGVSLDAFLKGGEAPQRDYFYWELHEGKPIQAVRFDNWKGVRNGPNAPWEIYDLANDPGESRDLAKEKPDLVEKAGALVKKARTDHPVWPWSFPENKTKLDL
jgi:arylsulfatase A